MVSEQRAMIYLSSQRGCTQSDWFRTFHSLNFGSYFNKYRTPSSHLTAFNDETLKASHTIAHPAVKNCTVLLLPVVGGIEYALDEQQKVFVEAGESVLISVAAGSVLHIKNPYEYEVVNYLHAWLSALPQSVSSKTAIDLPAHQNNFVSLFLTIFFRHT
jgi:hypothetical protein